MALQSLSRSLIVLAIMASFVVTVIAFAIYSSEASQLRILRYTTILNSSIETVYSFNPCSGDSSPGLSIEILFVATKPASLIVLDEEQYREFLSRSDLYGYLAYATNASKAKLRFYYAKSIPCWPIYVVAKGVPGTRIELKIAISRSD